MKKIIALVLALFIINSTIVLAVTSRTNIAVPTISTAKSTAFSKKLVLGYTTYYNKNDTSSYNSLSAKSTIIDEIATDTYTTDSAGNLKGTVPASQVSLANSRGIKSFAMVTNNFSPTIAKAVLEHSSTRQTLIKNILSALKVNNYKGVNIDMEGIYYYDRSYFSTFMSELYSALHPLGFMVTIAVPAKTYDSTTNSWNGAYDYVKLGTVSDQVILMAYDEHYSGGSPGPVASIGWVQNVVNYAASVIPPEKLLLGLAAYGYDWYPGGTKSYDIDSIYNLALTHKSMIGWDPLSLTPFFNYTDNKGIQHTVWFENSTSIGYKLDIVNSKNIAGIAIWRLGLENSSYWDTIKVKLNK